MSDVITQTDLQLHERVAKMETYTNLAHEAIQELAKENKKSAENIQKQGYQIEQLATQVKKQGEQWDKTSKDTNRNIELLGKRVTKYAILFILMVSLGIIFNSPEKIPSLLSNIIPAI